ncbi:MAG: hypothetical protein O2816_10795, partial [Planctomycetota bacterium]|nr:hypothetical protein [Planctomycetota bacterium]
MVESNGGNGQLVLQLKEALPGFHALDRGLTVGGVYVELVGKDGDGRLLLVRAVERVDDAVLTELLDLVALARTQSDLLARHLGGDRGAEPPLVVLVAGEVDARAARRLTALEHGAVRVLKTCTIQSERAASTFLVPHGPA